MKVTFCIPVYNEEDIIGETVREISSTLEKLNDIEWNVVVCDNGSTDKSSTIVAKQNNPRVKILNIKERGKGIAIKETLREFPCDIFGFTDADLSVEPNVIIGMVQRILRHEANVVIGSRMHPETVSDRNFLRRLSSRIYNTLAHFFNRVRLSDIQCPMKVMDSEGSFQLSRCLENSWFIDLEFVARCQSNGLRVLEVPILWRETYFKKRKSKINLIKDGFNGLAAMIRIRNRV